MALYSIGDQARAFAVQVASNRLKTSLGTLSDELASGEVSDIGQRLQGNTQVLRRIEIQLAAAQQYGTNSEEASLWLNGMQEILGQVQSQTSELGLSLLASPFAETEGLLRMRSGEAGDMLASVVSHLNGNLGGAYLFSGQNVGQPALRSGAEILSELETLTAGLTTATDVAAAVEDWFDGPEGAGGFLDVAYKGSLDAPLVFPVSEGQSISVTTTAASSSVREVLTGLATAALVDRGILTGEYHEQRELLRRGGQILVDNDADLLAEMARIGQKQQFAQRSQAENYSAIAMLQTARNDMRVADPFETAGALTQVETQLQTLYTVTARLSQLRLSEFLR